MFSCLPARHSLCSPQIKEQERLLRLITQEILSVKDVGVVVIL